MHLDIAFGDPHEKDDTKGQVALDCRKICLFSIPSSLAVVRRVQELADQMDYTKKDMEYMRVMQLRLN